MTKVKIVTDSTNDLSKDLLEKYGVDVVPLYVEFGEVSYRDGVDITPGELFQKVMEKDILPKTAAPSPYDFYQVFQRNIDQGYDIVAVTLSSELSSTYQNALLAASHFPAGRISIVDSRSLSTGIGILVLAAGDWMLQGLEAKEIFDKTQALVPCVQVSFVVDTLDYLFKGGRCNAVQNMIGSLLKIRPIIGLQDGRMYVKDKVRGDKKRALDKMISEIKKNCRMEQNRIIITYSPGSEDEVSLFQRAIIEDIPGADVYITSTGCVISSHCGPKTVGVIHVLNE